MPQKPATKSTTSKTSAKPKRLSDAELEQASGAGRSRVARNSTAARQARTPKR